MPEEEYQDYIANKPQRFLLLNTEQHQIVLEHATIIKALSQGNMSVKEIHNQYLIPGTKKHSKTLKTIYRYMDTLENAGLVMIAGYRKGTDSRGTEKLYCRTARVFFNKDNQHKEQWLTTQEGQEYLESLTQIMWNINKKENPPPPELKTHITDYIKGTRKEVNKVIDKITTDEKLANILDKHSVSEMQKILEITSQIQTMLETDTLDQIKKTLKP